MGRAGPAERTILAADEAVVMRQAGTSPPLFAVRHAQGVWLEDTSGRRYIDLHGNNCHHIGHRHPRVLAALTDQLERVAFVPRGLTAEPVARLGEALLQIWPGAAGRVFLVPGGSSAVELALLLARAHTGRWKTISFHDSYHGRSAGALSLSGRRRARVPRLGPLVPGCLHVPPFYPLPGEPRGPDGVEAAARRSLSAVSTVLREEGEIAAIIAETVRNGPFVPPDWYWPEIRRLCDAHEVLLVSDEIPTGLGKTGRMFNTEHFGVRPDMTVLGKALGGAVVPLAAVIASEQLDTTGDLALGYFTHERSPLLARVGLEVLKVIHDDGLVHRSEEQGRETLEWCGASCTGILRCSACEASA
jgi:4-aminobutyrate aminotransferase